MIADNRDKRTLNIYAYSSNTHAHTTLRQRRARCKVK